MDRRSEEARCTHRFIARLAHGPPHHNVCLDGVSNEPGLLRSQRYTAIDIESTTDMSHLTKHG
jgi:hypothetical protein